MNEGALDNYLGGAFYFGKIIIKIRDGDVSSYTPNKLKSFTLIVQYPGTTPVQYFPRVKKSWLERDRQGRRDLDVHKP